MEADIAIIGGGPAGSAAALTFGRYTRWRVVLVEGSSYETERVGETVSSAIGPLLEYLGVGDILRQEYHLPGFGTAAAWGSAAVVRHEFLFTGRGNGWHLDRREFDAGLADAAARTGVSALRNTRLAGAHRADGVWHLALAGGGHIEAQTVIDATGRRSSFARASGARRRRLDRLVALVGFFILAPGRRLEQSVQVEAVADGWWYSAPLSRGRAVAAFMTDADQLGPGPTQEVTVFSGLLEQAPLTTARLADATLTTPPRIRLCGSEILAPCCGEGWVAAGEAAVSFDPLSSMGIGFALASGIHAARVSEASLKGDEAAKKTYSDDISRHMQAYLTQRRDFYAAERRWPDNPFWARRHAA